MAVTVDQMRAWCEQLLAADAGPAEPLTAYLDAIPTLDSLADLPSGAPVLVRGDVDAKPGETVGTGDIRLRSMVDTLEFGRRRGWKQIVFGHIGRKPEGSLDKVARRLGELLGCDVSLIDDWCDEAAGRVTDAAAAQIAAAPAGAVLVLQNTRKYAIERALWKAQPEELPALAEKLASLANDLAERVARAYVFEALSAGNRDTSSCVVPAAMQRVALGKYVAAEFRGPMMQCLEAETVVFSGIKIDKLSKLESMLDAGRITRVISAGSLAMALKKALAQLAGGDFCIGATEDPANAHEGFYIPPERIEQAKQMIGRAQARGVEFVLPVDFVMADGSVKKTLDKGDQQFDIGPETVELFRAKVVEMLAALAAENRRSVLFHNGVFGMFEDPRYENGTRSFVRLFEQMQAGGIDVYVGGGEGGAALEKYGDLAWVAHNFTAGGTVLSAVGGEPIPYLVALRAAAQRG